VPTCSRCAAGWRMRRQTGGGRRPSARSASAIACSISTRSFSQYPSGFPRIVRTLSSPSLMRRTSSRRRAVSSPDDSGAGRDLLTTELLVVNGFGTGRQARGDDPGGVAPHCEGDSDQPVCGGESGDQKSVFELGVPLIVSHERVRILEHGDGLREGDEVLALVFGRFGRIPFKCAQPRRVYPTRSPGWVMPAPPELRRRIGGCGGCGSGSRGRGARRGCRAP
jgi:hypothetical protein